MWVGLMDEQQNRDVSHTFFDKMDSEDYNKYIQNMEKPIETLILKFRGCEVVYSPDLQKYVVKQTSKPQMNDEGINYYEGLLRSHLIPNLYMAQMEDQQAHNYIIGAKKQIGIITNRNRITWGITIDNIRPIISVICSVVAFGIIKSKTDKEFMANTIQAKYANMSRDGQAHRPQDFGFG